MAEEQNERRVYDSPVHGSRDQSVREVEARLSEAPPSNIPMPQMRHEVRGTSLVVEESSGNAAAEASDLVLPNTAAPAAKNAGSG